MDMNRREFLKAVAVVAALPEAGGISPASTWTVNRKNMWGPDRTSEEALTRCNRILVADPNNVLALVHRGSVPEIYTDKAQAWGDLTRATALEPGNPCIYYLRRVCFDKVDDLRHASVLLETGNPSGKAICSSAPDYYKWDGTEESELFYLAQRELGFTLGQYRRFPESVAAYKKAASFEVISQENLEAWAESSFLVETYSRAFVEYDRLIVIEPKCEYIRRREECVRRMRP